MRTYEALYIVRPDLEDENVQAIAKEVESLVTDNGGTIIESDIWGKRRLAYKVRKFTEGTYVLLRFEAEPEVIDKIKHYFKLSEGVIRNLIVHFDEKTLRLEAEQKKRKEAELAKAAALGAGRNRSDDDDDDSPRPRRRPRDDDDEEEEEEEE